MRRSAPSRPWRAQWAAGSMNDRVTRIRPIIDERRSSMARSERARELAAKQKAEAKALREKKRNSTNPQDWGTIRQIRETYKVTRQFDPQLNVWLIGSWVLVILVGLGLGLLAGGRQWIFGLIAGALFGFTAALFILTRRAKTAAFKRYAGQPGAGEVALSTLNAKQWTTQPAIVVTRQQDCIHRAVGPAGVVLVGDGDPARLRTVLSAEHKRHQQVLYGIPVLTIQMGTGTVQVPMDRLARHIGRLPRSLDSVQLDEARNRLKALDAMKQRVPLPKGPLPSSMKGTRRAMRGR